MPLHTNWHVVGTLLKIFKEFFFLIGKMEENKELKWFVDLRIVRHLSSEIAEIQKPFQDFHIFWAVPVLERLALMEKAINCSFDLQQFRGLNSCSIQIMVNESVNVMRGM